MSSLVVSNRLRDERILDTRILDALAFANADNMISQTEDHVLWKSLTYLMNHKLRVQKLKFILDKKFGMVRGRELIRIMLYYFKKVDCLNKR